MKRHWKQTFVGDDHVAEECEKLTDDEWTIFSVSPVNNTMEGAGDQQAVLIVAWRDEPTVEPGKPVPPVQMP